jgi:hypothetical protein
MARERGFPASRNRNVENPTSWVLALLALGVLAALLVVAVVPAGTDVADEPGVTEHVVPNTPPPVRVE